MRAQWRVRPRVLSCGGGLGVGRVGVRPARVCEPKRREHAPQASVCETKKAGACTPSQCVRAKKAGARTPITMLIPEALLPAALSRAVAGTAVVVGMATPALYTADAVHRAARSGMNGRERERRGDTPRTAARSSTTSRSSAARSLSDGTADPDAASKPMRARTCHVPSSKGGREVRGVPRGINGHHSEERTRQHGVVRRRHVSTGW